MKRFLTLLFFLLPLALLADNVTEQRAKDFATQFLKSSMGTRSASVSLKLVYNGIDSATRGSDDNPLLYVFNNTQGGGFVIISGDDAVTPILGYSSENNFKEENPPANLKFWLDNYAAQIRKVRQLRLKPDSKVIEAWKGMTRADVGSIIKEYETARWGQGAPYNGDCFVIDGKHCVTGCVATATAIVLRFNQWPDQGIGTLPSYTYKLNVDGNERTFVVPERPLNTLYDWNNMPLGDEEITTLEQKEQIARLMADCGVMVQAGYWLNSTGANSGNISGGLAQYMKYDKSCRYAVRASFANDTWHSMLEKELQTRPIIYSGDGNAGGHAFVLYGYTDKRFYGTNWGWNGYANGYFLLDVMQPDASAFNKGQTAILGLKKDAGGSYFEDFRFSEGFENDGVHHGLLVADGTDFTKTFTVKVNSISNMGNKTSKLFFKLALVDQKGNEKESIWDGPIRQMTPGELLRFSLDVRITKPIEVGDRIRSYYHTDSSIEWKLIEGNLEKGIVWEIIVKEEIENFTKHVNLIYDKETKILELTGLAGGVKVKLTNAEGTDFTDKGKSDGMAKYTLDTKLLVAGTYTFSLTKSDFGEIKTAQLKVVLGDKK